MFKIGTNNQIFFRATSIHPEWLGTISFSGFSIDTKHVEFDCIGNSLIIAVPISYQQDDKKIWIEVIDNCLTSDSCSLWLRPGSGYTYKIFENEFCYRTLYISYEQGDASTVPIGYDFIFIQMDSIPKEI
jgi:hypothetical protein